MPTRRLPLSLLTLLALLGLAAGCDRKAGSGSSDTEAPAPEIVMPETTQPTAVESAPTLATGTEPAATPLPPAGTTAPTDPNSVMPPATGPGPAVTMPPPADPLLSVAQGKAAAIDAGIAGYTMRSQPQVFGDVRSDVSVYTSAGQVVLIEEKLTTSDKSIATNRYYFDAGSLFFYQDDGRWLDLDPPKPLVTRNTKRSMAFTATGKLITGAKTVDGSAATLGEYEAVAVLARAQQVLGGQPAPAATAAKPEGTPAPAAAAATKAEAKPSPAATTKPDAEAATRAEPASKPKRPSAETEPSAKPSGDGERVAGRNSTLRGLAPVRGTRDFVVPAKAGQLMTLSLSGASNTFFAVYSSRGEIVSELTNWSSKLPRDGDYTIKVGQKGGSAPAEFTLKLTLE